MINPDKYTYVINVCEFVPSFVGGSVVQGHTSFSGTNSSH